MEDMNRAKSDNIAVFIQDRPFLGNQIVLIPFFYFLRKVYPIHNILVCGSRRASNVLQTLEYIDSLYPYETIQGTIDLIKTAKKLSRKIVTTAFTHRRHSMKTALLARLGCGNKLVGFSAKTTNFFLTKKVQFDLKGYAAQNFLSLIDKDLKDFPSQFNRKNGHYFVIIPGGSFIQKKYPIEKYIAIAQDLWRIAPVHFLLGKDMLSDIVAMSGLTDRFSIHIGKPLKEVERIVRNASVVISNDCGPSHFAHIYDIPRVSLFSRASKISGWFNPTRKSVMLVPPSGQDIGAIGKMKIIEETIQLHVS